MKYQVEQIQASLGVTADGVIGPNTITVIASVLNCKPDVKSIQASVGVTSDGVIGPITINAIIEKLGIKDESDDSYASKLVNIASTQLGIYETSKNHGEGIEKYWKSTSYPDGYKNREPYCAAAVCWIIQESGKFSEATRPKSATAFGYESWAGARNLRLLKPPTKIKKGDIVIFNFSHIGIAAADSNRSGNFLCIEANTSDTSTGNQRDGGGVYKKTRNIALVRSVVRI